jgi:hypothetical protein
MNELEWRKNVITYPGGTIDVVHILGRPDLSVPGANIQYAHWEYKAYVTKLADRKWGAQILGGTQDGQRKTFRTLKAAKAYALAIVRLNQ